jgi:RNA polymerase sigma-70 factor (ECF subfamily)
MSDWTGTARAVQSREAVFARLYDRHYRSIYEYCRRRVASHVVDDSVAETFLIAWRRLDDVPAADEALLWLYGVAHRVVAHQWRGDARRRRLQERLRLVSSNPGSVMDESVIDGDQCRRVLDAATRLGDTDAEVLRLVAWEQLSSHEVATVLAIEPNAVKQRLHRARRNLAREYRRLESRQNSAPDAPKRGVR